MSEVFGSASQEVRFGGFAIGAMAFSSERKSETHEAAKQLLNKRKNEILIGSVQSPLTAA
jgi:hypothetical protein